MNELLNNPKKSFDNSPASKSVSQWLLIPVFIFVFFGAGWKTLTTVETEIKTNLQQQLNSSLDLLTENLKIWKVKEIADVEFWAQEPEVRQKVQAMVSHFNSGARSRSQLLASPYLAKLRLQLKSLIERRKDIGFVIILPSGLQIGAYQDALVGKDDLIKRDGGFIARALQGKSDVSLPFWLTEDRYEQGILHSGEYVQLGVAPIRDTNGMVVAVLGLLRHPDANFTPILKVGHPGQLGEAYAFNAQGLLISESRFLDDLKDKGVIPDQPDIKAMLRLEIRDPGERFSKSNQKKRNEFPFTQMAVSALAGERGVDVNGYRDYRGIPVVGAWAWLSDMHFGIAVEMDTSEAFVLLSRLEGIFLAILLLLFVLGLGYLILQLQERSTQHKFLELQKGAKKQSEHFNVIFNNIVDGAITISSKGIIESINPSGLQIFGYKSEGELIGKNVSMLMPSEEGEKHDGYLEKYLKTGVAHIIGIGREVEGKRKDGSYFPMDLAVSEVTLSEERFFIGIVRDISERKRIERALKTETQYLKFLTASALAANDYADFERAMEHCMAQVCDLIQWPAGHLFLCDSENNQLVSTNIWHMESNEAFIPFKKVTEETGFTPGKGLPGRVMASGESEWIEDILNDTTLHRAQMLNPCPFHGAFGFPVLVKGQVVAVLEFFSNKAEPRNERILEVTRDVGVQISRVMERIEYENNLVAAKEEAERASRVKSEFLSRMSHELRTPLNAILGFSQLLEIDDSISESNKNFIGRISGAGKHLLDLINEVLDLARLDAGKIAITLEPCHLKAVAEDAFSLIRPLAEEKNIRLNNKIQNDSFFVIADNIRLRQVLLNLLSNAIKYNEEKGSVILDCMQSEGYICIKVTDTGKGIDLAHKDDLFEPFNRMGETDAHIEGAGIGLAITKKLTELMKGFIDVESEFGKGSCFTIKIPGGAVDSLTPGLKPSEELPPMPSREVKPMRKVLYIEDNPDNLELVKSIFRRHSNMKLLSAVSAELGVEMAEVHQPDLILMDINLPGMLGDEAFLKLQMIETTKNIPVIALSANAMKRDIRSALDKGFIDYITKPIEVSSFMKTIQRVLDNS